MPEMRARASMVSLAPPRLRRLVRSRLRFPGSAGAWSQRYNAGGTSGAGSSGRLAEFKAEVLNEFVERRSIGRVLELGCGDGSQLALAHYPSYIGLDVAADAIERCQTRFADDRSKSFYLYAPPLFVDNHRLFTADLTMSLDVVFHLVEDEVFEVHMRHLFDASERWVIVYSSNRDEPPPGDRRAGHVRHRTFTRWVDAERPDWRLVEAIDQRYPYEGDELHTSFSDFYVFERAR